jgi:hypothetical protein
MSGRMSLHPAALFFVLRRLGMTGPPISDMNTLKVPLDRRGLFFYS